MDDTLDVEGVLRLALTITASGSCNRIAIRGATRGIHEIGACPTIPELLRKCFCIETNNLNGLQP